MHAYVSNYQATGQGLAVAVAETRTPTPRDPRGEAMAAELKWVHDMIRRDLRTIRQMAADAAAGRALQQLSADLLAHLQYEEDHISGTLRTWSDWPWG